MQQSFIIQRVLLANLEILCEILVQSGEISSDLQGIFLVYVGA
jgi:hypothetical protein